jgi:hypothetical protein
MRVARTLIKNVLDVFADDARVGVDVACLVVRGSRESPEFSSDEGRYAGHQIVNVFAHAISILISPWLMGEQTHVGLRPGLLQ